MASARNRGGVEVIAFGMNGDGVRQIHYDGARSAQEVADRLMLDAGREYGARLMQEGGPGVTLFKDVRRIGIHPAYDLIDLTLRGNYKCRVYVRAEDLDFVRDYIRQRAPQAR